MAARRSERSLSFSMSFPPNKIRLRFSPTSRSIGKLEVGKRDDSKPRADHSLQASGSVPSTRTYLVYYTYTDMWWSRVSIRDQRSATVNWVLGNSGLSYIPEFGSDSMENRSTRFELWNIGMNECQTNGIRFFLARILFQGSVDKFYVGEAERNRALIVRTMHDVHVQTVFYPFTAILQLSKYLSEEHSPPPSKTPLSFVSILIYCDLKNVFSNRRFCKKKLEFPFCYFNIPRVEVYRFYDSKYIRNIFSYRQGITKVDELRESFE